MDGLLQQFYKKEEWRPILGYEGFYEVSSFGRIKSLPKKVGKGSGFTITNEKVLSPHIHSSGYCKVSLYLHGKQKTVSVHRLVLEAFVGKSDLSVDHIDSDKSNNAISNLRYCTQRQNVHHHFLNTNKSSRYIGVYWEKRIAKWKSRIFIDGKRIFLGVFDNEFDAHSAYKNRKYAG